jgi:hypothetical protein
MSDTECQTGSPAKAPGVFVVCHLGRIGKGLRVGFLILKSSRNIKRKELIPQAFLRDIFRPEALRDKRKRDKSMGEAVFEYGTTQREVADHLRLHVTRLRADAPQLAAGSFTSVSRILRAKDKMPRK